MVDSKELSGEEVAATLAALKQRVRVRHGLPPTGPDPAPGDERTALTAAMDAAHISAHFPILWEVPVAGRALALTKRAVRILLRWYINPIVDQQNDFNAAVVRALNELAAEQERMRSAECGVRNKGDGGDAIGSGAPGLGAEQVTANDH